MSSTTFTHTWAQYVRFHLSSHRIHTPNTKGTSRASCQQYHVTCRYMCVTLEPMYVRHIMCLYMRVTLESTQLKHGSKFETFNLNPYTSSSLNSNKSSLLRSTLPPLPLPFRPFHLPHLPFPLPSYKCVICATCTTVWLSVRTCGE
jgi:hypothetical protein